MSNSLEERLKAHSSAFDGLLSLIPAKYYYDDATQDQWQQKKRSKQEAQQVKRAKFDPDSKSNADEYNNGYASAKDVLENIGKKAKKVTLPSNGKLADTKEAEVADDGNNDSDDKPTNQDAYSKSVDEGEFSLIGSNQELVFDDNGDEVVQEQEAKSQKNTNKSKSAKKELSPEQIKKKNESLALLREKLNAKISSMKEKRKAPDSKAADARSREQILEERRRKAELKRQEKLKKKSDELEDEQEGEDVESDSDSENEAVEEKDVLYGNIDFDDGSRVTSDLKKIRTRKNKGPSNNDLKAHLNKLEQKSKKLDALSTEEKQSQMEKDRWQKIMLQADGVKVKDDEKLLKKALKKKEKQKLKSEIEWRERKQIVQDTTAARQKRKEENLKARRDNKGKKGKNQPRLRKFQGTVNKAATKKNRAGFEGSAKSRGKNRK